MAAQAAITLTVDGEEQFNRVFSRLDAYFDDLTPIWPDVRDEFWRIEREQFDSEGGKGASGRWKELSTRYKAEKIKRYGAGKKILEATGALRESLTGDNEGSYYMAGKKEVAIGTVIPYGIYHQRGSDKLPQRKPIDLSEEQKRKLTDVIHKSLVRELRTGRYYVPLMDRPIS